MSTPRVEPDGDVEMSVAQPVYEYIRAPRLTAWSQPALAQYVRDRRQYEAKIEERCAVTSEAPETVTVSIKSSFEPRVLDHVARYVLKKDVFNVTDADLSWQISRKVGTMVNDHVPDVERLFGEQLRMDLRESDIEARVATYWMNFDKLVEDNGLSNLLGAAPATDEQGNQRMKLRCKLLMQHLQSEILRTDVMRLASLTHTHVKRDDLSLYDLVVDRATRQQQSHLMQMEQEHVAGRKKPDEKQNKEKGKSEERNHVTAGRSVATVKAVPVQRSPPKDGCLICKKAHWLRDCPSATREQKEEALRRLKGTKTGLVERTKAIRSLLNEERGGEARVAVINSVLEVPFCADSGSDSNIVSRRIVNELLDLDSTTVPILLEQPVTVMVAGGGRMECTESVTVDLTIHTAAGPLYLHNVWCLVLEGPGDEFLLGRRTMNDIGINVDGMLEELAGQGVLASADRDDLGDSDPLVQQPDEEIHPALVKMIEDAMAAGFDPGLREALEYIVFEYADVWRLRLGLDPPARVEPMRVVLKPDVLPYRSASRKYPDMQRAFLREYVRDLEANGLIERNNASRWASAAHPVRKQGGDEYRITVDYRQVNMRTVPLAGATPNLSAVTQSVRGAYGFGQFDFFKGFWQLPLHPESRELFSFLTEDGVFTPTRVPQGAADSALHFQAQMHDVFREQLYDSVLVWIDDVLLFATTPDEFIQKLRVFFSILRERNLKLNAKKCKLFAPRVVWCGKLVDGEGLEHDPARLRALQEMPLPPTAAALQNFLCAVNWLRDSMVDYGRSVAPLQAKLEGVMKARGRKKTQLAGVDLAWSADEEGAFQIVLKLLATSTKQYFVDPAATVCLFTDASNDGWAVVLTQVTDWNQSVPVHEQDHQLLVCRGGEFKGAEKNWSVIEKEAYPIVRACDDLSYLLEREKGFEIFCDHSNLVKIFAPDKDIKQHVKGKLQRWTLRMIGHRYTIHHISGENNLWADIVSRWGQRFGSEESNEAVKRVTTRSATAVSMLRPLQDESFVWPTAADIRREQDAARRPAEAVEFDGLWRVNDKVWVPDEAAALLQRLMIVAHCGPTVTVARM